MAARLGTVLLAAALCLASTPDEGGGASRPSRVVATDPAGDAAFLGVLGTSQTNHPQVDLLAFRVVPNGNVTELRIRVADVNGRPEIREIERGEQVQLGLSTKLDGCDLVIGAVRIERHLRIDVRHCGVDVPGPWVGRVDTETHEYVVPLDVRILTKNGPRNIELGDRATGVSINASRAEHLSVPSRSADARQRGVGCGSCNGHRDRLVAEAVEWTL